MTDSKAFGKLLTEFRLIRGISQEDLGSKIKISKSRLMEWEAGSKTPNFDYAQRIVKALSLENEQARYLLSLAGHDHNDVIFSSGIYHPTGLVINDQATERSRKENEQTIQKFNEQLAQTQHAIDEISSKLDKTPPNQTKEKGEIISEIHKLKESLADVRISSQSITAPVILPPPEDMEVRLVSSTSLQRLEEYRSEENKWYAVMGIFLGAVLGIFINVTTGGSMTSVAWILVATFAGFGALTGLTARNYQTRGNEIRARILRDRIETYSDSNHENNAHGE
jgi:transcriptional regulator with XRE-family HTH domain